jgi:hypothetical protein
MWAIASLYQGAFIGVMNAKKWCWSVGSFLIAGLVAGAVWWLSRPPSIALSTGTKLTLLGVSYGKHPKPPKSAGVTGRGRGAFSGTNDFLVVWLRQQRRGQQWPNYQLYAYDEKGEACAGFSGMTYLNNNQQKGEDVVGIRLDAFPRRESKFKLRLQEWNPQTGVQTVKDAFTVRNPARGPFPKWNPDSLPITQSDDDLEVTLNQFSPGQKTPYQRNGQDPNDAMNRGVEVAFDVRQGGNAATNWAPVQVITSDATGNSIIGWINRMPQGGDPTTVFQWGLWPDEPAWKVRFEFSRTTGFHDDELWTVQDVPVAPDKMQNFWNFGPRNRNKPAFAEVTLNGIHLKLFPAMKFTDQQGGLGRLEGGFTIETKPAPEGMRMTVVNLTAEDGHKVRPMNWGTGGTQYRFGLQDLGDAKTLNLTIALHKSRFVEFTVKPKS